MAVMRLDKFLTDTGTCTRSEAKAYAKAGRIKVNGVCEKKTDIKIDPSKDKVTLDLVPIQYEEYEYYMLNKPAGCISATEDKKCKTVIDLIETKKRSDLFPVGRLDKDTEGLLLITNDGELCHNLLSPKKHVDKVYYAKVVGPLKKEHVKEFAKGMELLDGTIVKPADLEILKIDEESEVRLTIYEGKFHQVKRMFEAVGCEVIYLKRLSMGNLVLDDKLSLGEYRELTEEELTNIKR